MHQFIINHFNDRYFYPAWQRCMFLGVKEQAAGTQSCSRITIDGLGVAVNFDSVTLRHWRAQCFSEGRKRRFGARQDGVK